MVTTNKSFIEPAYNNTSGTLPNGTPYTSWDSAVNYNSDVLDSAFGGVTAISVTGVNANQTLTLAQYQPLIINFTGVLGQALTYNFPTGVGGYWLIRNSCTGSFNLSVGSNGTTIVLPVGQAVFIFVDTTTSPYIRFLQQSNVITYAGNPNTNVAGNSTSPASLVFDTTNNKLWVCTTGGIAASAVWTSSSGWLLTSANTWTSTNTFSGAVTNSSSVTNNGSVVTLEQTLTVTSHTAAWDMTQGPNAYVTDTANLTISNPSNLVNGQSGTLRINANVASTSSMTVTFGSNYSLNGVLVSLVGGTTTTYNYVVQSGVVQLSVAAGQTYQALITGISSGTSKSVQIPSWTKTIQVAIAGLKSSGNSGFVVQIGSGSLSTSGYSSTSTTYAAGTTTYTNGFGMQNIASGNVLSGVMTLALIPNVVWAAQFTVGMATTQPTASGGGNVVIGNFPTVIGIATANGSDPLAAGNVSFTCMS